MTLSEEGYERTASVLTNELGFIPTHHNGSRFKYEILTKKSVRRVEDVNGANIVDVLCLPYTQQAVTGIGSSIMSHIVHHMMNNKRSYAAI